MKLSPTLKSNFIYAIALLHILVFTYAAFSKLADYESFTIQLGQSPLLSAFAGWVAWFIPSLELLIVFLLILPSTRFFALTASFALMVMFSAYIYIILHYSEFVPCSCGGILERMTWNEHLLFNLIFSLLALIAVLLSSEKAPHWYQFLKIRHKLLLLLGVAFVACSFVLILFLKSEQIIHQENNFVRRYPPHLYSKSKQLDLKFEGYYFAGVDENTIYLGNYTAPLSILAIDRNLKIIANYKIELDDYNLPFRAALVKISPPYFFLTDGTVPCIFKGKISDWKGSKIPKVNLFFSVFEPIDSSTAAVRSRNYETNESILGVIRFANDTTTAVWNKLLLQKQIDGVFDCDGLLQFNEQNQNILYTYFYRNEFIVSDRNLKMYYRSNTIDTTSKAKIKIVTLKNGDRKLGEPPLVVNKLTSTVGNQLFINSNLRGHYESIKLWKETSVIDVYDIKSKMYEYSFYVYHVDGKKPQAMYATKSNVYFMFERVIVSYQIDSTVRRSLYNIRNKIEHL